MTLYCISHTAYVRMFRISTVSYGTVCHLELEDGSERVVLCSAGEYGRYHPEVDNEG